jgi:hypothetical protein
MMIEAPDRITAEIQIARTEKVGHMYVYHMEQMDYARLITQGSFFALHGSVNNPAIMVDASLGDTSNDRQWLFDQGYSPSFVEIISRSAPAWIWFHEQADPDDNLPIHDWV